MPLSATATTQKPSFLHADTLISGFWSGWRYLMALPMRFQKLLDSNLIDERRG